MSRIAKQGGFVHQHRVSGVLAVARAFGDRELKTFVTAEPHVSVTRYGAALCRLGSFSRLLPYHTSSFSLGENNRLENMIDYPFLVLACDGVWDEVGDQEAVDLVSRLSDSDAPKAADMLVQEALRRKSADNITAVVVFF